MPISRRNFLATSGALALPAAFTPDASAVELKGAMKLTMPVGGLSEQGLNFVALMGVEWITTSGPGGPTYNDEGRVIKMGGDTSEPPWKEEDIRRIKDRVEAAG